MRDLVLKMMEPLKVFVLSVMAFLPKVMVLAVILAVGFLVAWLTRVVATGLMKVVGFNGWSDKVGLSSVLEKAEVRSLPSKFVGSVLYWLVLIVFVMAGLASLGLETTDMVVTLTFQYFPKFVTAVVIVVLGYIFASFLARATLIAAVNARIVYSRLLGEAVRLLALVFVFAMALEQLGIARGIVVAAFSIFFGGVLLALAIAFGLGGADVAKKILESQLEEHDKDDIKHL